MSFNYIVKSKADLSNLLLFFWIFLCPSFIIAQTHSSIKWSGDVISLAIPATALGMSFMEENNLQATKELVLVIGAASWSSYMLKHIIDLDRPDGMEHGFPSTHTSVAFAGATFICKRYGLKYGLPAIFGAGFVGWSRMQVDKHDIWQVLAGAGLGWVLGELITTSGKKTNITISPSNICLNIKLN
ncbi:MAG TPA: phosphatase PAP2 family protein [Saprospirales bacterium]|nr:phosphatase PAP2 family protein [Saprospirales bacterium]HAY70490.1 phosphatase PAP2 family protein [Saprospirales bacterium]HRQ30873.1 phosphatase PAP2 family protein [Saprospiraceae bacterium]